MKRGCSGGCFGQWEIATAETSLVLRRARGRERLASKRRQGRPRSHSSIGAKRPKTEVLANYVGSRGAINRSSAEARVLRACPPGQRPSRIAQVGGSNQDMRTGETRQGARDGYW